MNARRIRFFLPLIGLALATVIYWPALKGGPIWDDHNYWFEHPSIITDYSLINIWLDFNWPVTVTFQKVLFALFGTKYFYYHSFSLVLHWVNSLLLWRALKRFKIPYSDWIMLIFVVHPANVISVSWMIQLKTLLCFLFAILANEFLFIASRKKHFWPVSWAFFLLSIFSKSASVILPVIYLGAHYTKLSSKQLRFMLPFFLISFWGIYRLYQSPVTSETLSLLEGKKIIQTTEVRKGPEKITIQGHEVSPITAPLPLSPPPLEKKPLLTRQTPSKAESISAAVFYYFWQVLVPVNLVPVKSYSQVHNFTNEIIHFILLGLLIVIFWSDSALGFLLAGYLTLIPFLGILSAPYMNITFVSDQHLYLGLPFFLAFLACSIDKFKIRHSWLVPLIVTMLFTFKSRSITPLYQSEIVFFDTLHHYGPENIPIAYNLSYTYVMHGQYEQALEVTTPLVDKSKDDKHIASNPFFPLLLKLHFQIMELRKQK